VNFCSSKLTLEKKKGFFLHQFHVENTTKIQMINYSRNTTDFFLMEKYQFWNQTVILL